MAKSGIKASSNLQARIKRMMQSDEDVGKVAKASPVLIAKALDIFLASMVDGATAIAESRGAKMLTPSHIKAHIQGEVLLDFLKDAVAEVPDLPPAGSEPPKPARPKRQRSKSVADEDGGSPKARSRSTRSRGGRGGRGGRGRGRKGASTDDEEAAAEVAQSPEGQSAAMDVDGGAQQHAAAGEVDAGAEPVSQQKQEQEQQQQSGEQQSGEQQASGEGPAAPATAAPGADQGGTEGGATAAEGAAPPPINVPSFLAAAVAVPGAEAEEEDYDE